MRQRGSPMWFGRAGVVLMTAVALNLASSACKESPPATGQTEKRDYSSLFLKATFHMYEPVAGYGGRIAGTRLGWETNADGWGVIVNVPPGTWVVNSGLGPRWRADTLDFVAGQQETLWIDILAWPTYRMDGSLDTAATSQRRIKP